MILGNQDLKISFSALFLYPESGDKYTIYGRDPETETELKIMNIWKNGIFYWKNKKLFPDRMQNLAGRVLTATSFEYSPFIYKENPEDEKFQGYEVVRKYCIASDSA